MPNRLLYLCLYRSVFPASLVVDSMRYVVFELDTMTGSSDTAALPADWYSKISITLLFHHLEESNWLATKHTGGETVPIIPIVPVVIKNPKPSA